MKSYSISDSALGSVFNWVYSIRTRVAAVSAADQYANYSSEIET